MAAGADALAGAKAAAQSANDFQKSVSKQSGAPVQHAPYAMAHKARVDSGAAPASASKPEGDSDGIAAGIKWRLEQGKAANPDQ
jgi:hypothetical protein